MTRTFRDLLIDGLRDAYSAEQHLLNALPEMVRAARARKLSQHLQAHIATAETHITRLCGIFEALGEAPEGKVSLPMEGLVTESQKLAQEGLEPDVLDAALIASAHKIAHYEMAAYGSLCGFAEALGEAKAAKALRASFTDEKKFDAGLTALTRGGTPAKPKKKRSD